MAFFKFRWSGQEAPDGKPAKVSRAVRGETVEVMRRRARHRLIGAALLVLLGVIGFPLVFDTQPRPIAVDTRIEIPDRDKLAPLVVPAPVAVTPAARTPKAEPVAPPHETAALAKPVVEQVPATHKDGAAPAFVEAKPHAAPVKSEAKSEAKSEHKSEVLPPSVSKTVPPAPTVSEAERARALLEGRSGKVPSAAKTVAPSHAAIAAPVAAGGERFIVQVGAFSDEAKAREARQKLERAGLTTYTQVVDTKDGKRTRVRVGPFQGR
ncbi:MAG: SPOR domain-containing protein, partial [Giesbergeria sp.]